MVSEAEDRFEERVGALAGECLERYMRAPGVAQIAAMCSAIEPLVRALVTAEDARRRSDEDFVNASKERDRAVLSLEETTASLRAQTRARQEAESLAAQARHDAATFEAAARATEEERTKAEATLWREIEGLRKTVHLLRAAHVANMRVYLATVEGQS